MRIMVVDPGFEYSTLAVAQGYYNAFDRAGYEVWEYDTLRMLNVIRKGSDQKAPYQWMTEVAFAPIVNQVIHDKIDVVLNIHGYWMNPSIIVALRNLGVKTGLILTDDPMQVDAALEWSKYYEFIFSNDRNTVSKYRNGYYLPVGFDPLTFYQRKEVEDKYNSGILLAGSLYRERVDFIDNSQELKNVLHLADKIWRVKIVGARKIQFKDERINKYLGDARISIEEVSKYVSGTLIVLDIPKDEFSDNVFGQTNKTNITASCLSPRIFETFGSHRFCLTSHYRSDIRDLFPGYNIVTYGDANEMARLLNDYINHGVTPLYTEQWLDDICDYTRKNHTYDARLKTLEEIMDIHPSKKDFKYSTPLNNVVSKHLGHYWRKNFEKCKSAGYYTTERNIANCRPSTDAFKTGRYMPGLGLTPCWDNVNIISNGPSLENTYDSLGPYSGTNLYLNKACLDREFKGMPRGFGVVIHPEKDVFTRCFDKISFPKRLPLFASTIASAEVIEKWIKEESEVFFFNTGSEYDTKKEVYEYTKYDIIRSGYTVAYTAIQIAIYMGAKIINLFGVDCCYLGNKKYAWEKLDFNQLDKKSLNIVPTCRNSPVFVDTVMDKTRQAILGLIEDHPNIEFVVHGEGLLYSKKLSNLRNFQE